MSKDLEVRLEEVEQAQKKLSADLDFQLFYQINSPIAHAHLIAGQVKADEARKAIETLRANWLINEMLPAQYVAEQISLAENAVEAAREQIRKADEAPWHSLRVTLILMLIGLLGAGFVFGN